MGTFFISVQLRSYLDKLKGSTFEKNIPYMYVDTTGNVTIGVGHNLTSHGDYQSLPFVVKRLVRKAVLGGDQGIAIGTPQTIGRWATGAEKKNDYDFLKKHTGLGHYAPEHLAAYTTLELNQTEINQLFDRDLQDAISLARHTFGVAFDSYPVSCQAALIDIAFNCGGFSTFFTLVQAVKGEGVYAGKSWTERWKAAATHSKRGQVSRARNEQVAQWLAAGANGSP
jgi:GH24 family phage-related lysozyme (muramidase)